RREHAPGGDAPWAGTAPAPFVLLYGSDWGRPESHTLLQTGIVNAQARKGGLRESLRPRRLSPIHCGPLPPRSGGGALLACIGLRFRRGSATQLSLGQLPEVHRSRRYLRSRPAAQV